jgi:hypothetical protein
MGVMGSEQTPLSPIPSPLNTGARGEDAPSLCSEWGGGINNMSFRTDTRWDSSTRYRWPDRFRR